MIYNDKCELAEINQIVDTSKDVDGNNSFKPPSKGILNETYKKCMYWDTCLKCDEFGHLAKEYKTTSQTANQFENIIQDQPTIMFLQIHEVTYQPHKPQENQIPYDNFSNQTANINPTNYGRFSIIPRSLESNEGDG